MMLAFGASYMKTDLTEKECQLLEEHYARTLLDGEVHVKWKDFCDDIAAIGQVWFWVGLGSGIWLNTGKTLVQRGPPPAADAWPCEQQQHSQLIPRAPVGLHRPTSPGGARCERGERRGTEPAREFGMHSNLDRITRSPTVTGVYQTVATHHTQRNTHQTNKHSPYTHSRLPPLDPSRRPACAERLMRPHQAYSCPPPCRS